MEDLLGHGGMGTVLTVFDRLLDRTVAMKTLPRGGEHEGFLREARLGGQLEHPGIVPVYDYGAEFQGQPFITMRRVRGRTLADALSELRRRVEAGEGDASFPLRQRLEVFQRVCDAVAYAHSRGVLHRDLKPANVILGEFGEVQVVDWGLAVRIDEPEHALRAGTPGYSAPEQRAGCAAPDERVDLYSLGALLASLVTLRPPPPSGDKVGGGAGRCARPELDAIARKAMSETPSDRYTEVAQLRDEVDRFLDGRLPRAARPGWPRRLASWARRRRTPLLWATLLLLTIVGGSVAAEVAANRARRQQTAEELAVLSRRVEAAYAELDGVRAEIAAGRFEVALEQAERLLPRHDRDLLAVAGSTLASTESPQLVARAQAFAEHVTRVRHGLLEDWLRASTMALAAYAESPAATPDPVLQSARRTATRVRALVAGREPPALPQAALHHALAVVESARGDRPGMIREVGRAWISQPTSEAAARSLLLLGERELDEVSSHEQVARVVVELHRAWSILERRGSPLACRALLLLVRALLALPPEAGAPFAAEVPAYEMALRATLRLLDPEGNPRVGVATALASEPAWSREQFLAEARDSLAIARRICAPTPGLAHVHPRVEGVRYGWRREGMKWGTVEVPAAPGTDPVAFRVTGSLSIEALQHDPALRGARLDRCEMFPHTPLGPAAAFVFHVGGTTHRVALLHDLEAAAPDCILEVRARPERVRSGDLDGDGVADLVVMTGAGGPDSRAVWVYPGDGRGAFEPALALRVRGEAPAARSLMTDVRIADLDGDGVNELVVSRGEWENYAVEVWRLVGRQPQLVVTERVGEAEILVFGERENCRIFLSPFVGSATTFEAEVQGAPLRERPRMLRLRGDALVDVPFEAELSSRDQRVDSELRPGQPIELEDGWFAVCDKIRRLPQPGAHATELSWMRKDGPGDRFYRWFLWRQGAGNVRVRLVGTRLWNASRVVSTEGRPASITYASEGGVTRRLDRLDLEVVGMRPVPLAEPQPPVLDPDRALLSLLFVYDEPEAALHFLREAEGRRGDLEPECARALAESGRQAELIELLAGTRPTLSRFPMFLVAVERLVQKGCDLAPIVELLEQWIDSGALSTPKRNHLIRLRRMLTEANAAFHADPVELSAASPGQPWRMQTSGPGMAGAAPTGVAVKLKDGPTRISVELEVHGMAYGAGFEAGLFPVVNGQVQRVGHSITFSCRGGRQVEEIGLNPYFWLRIDPLLGRRLRIDLDVFPHLAMRRITVTDLQAREVIGRRTTGLGVPMARSDVAVLAVRQATDQQGRPLAAYGEVRLHSLRVCGNVRALSPEKVAALGLGLQSPAALSLGAPHLEVARLAERVHAEGIPSAAAYSFLEKTGTVPLAQLSDDERLLRLEVLDELNLRESLLGEIQPGDAAVLWPEAPHRLAILRSVAEQRREDLAEARLRAHLLGVELGE